MLIKIQNRSIFRTPAAIPQALSALLLLIAQLVFAVVPAPVSAGVGGGGPAESQLLKVEDAFRLNTGSTAPDRITTEWAIADGYYLYRERFRFKSETPGVSFGTPVFPAGQIKHDEFFGEMETYRYAVTVELPVIYADAAAKDAARTLQLSVTSQGCADIGVCYPPHTQSVSVNLASAAVPAAAQSGGLLANLADKLGLKRKGQTEFPPADEVFVPSVDVADPSTLVARWDIADGYYLYRERFGFAIKDGAGVTLGTPQSPAGDMKEDETFGRMEVYHKRVQIRLPLTRTSSAASELSLEVKYQGCAEAGFCYPPVTKVFPISLPADTTATTPGGRLSTAAPPPASGFVSEQDRFAQRLASGNIFATMAAFFGVGLLLAFTPCVFPMVPILSSIVAGQGTNTSPRKAFSLSAAYVLAMALTYTIAGVVAGLTGANLQAAFQNPWIIGTFSLLFVALALSMFGFYSLQIPAAWQSKLSDISNRQGQGTLGGAAIMGFLSALIVGPCVAAPLAGALIYISQSGDGWLGGVALFALSMGMGTPLLLIGTSAGKLLPRVGDWMNTVKAVFGVMLLALAVWMLERILPAAITMMLWAALAIVVAVYMGTLRRLGPDASGWQKLWQGVGLVALVYGVILMLGVASGGSDVLRPLERFALSARAGASGQALAATVPSHLNFTTIKGTEGLHSALAASASRGQPAMLDFYADWCVSCKEMERFTFSDPRVQQRLAGTTLLQADITANDAADQALLKQLGIIGPPALLFFDASGNERREYRIIGFMNPEQFLDVANQAWQK